MRNACFMERIRSGRMWSFLLILGILSLCALSLKAFAQPTALWFDESPFTGSDTEFLIGETVVIHIEGPVGDIYDVMIIYDPDLSPVVWKSWDNVTVPSGGEIVLNYEIAEGSPIVRRYQVQVLDATGSTLHLFLDYYLIRFNAPVLEFILELEEEIENLTAQMASLEHNLSLLESDISALEESIDSIENDISQLEADIDDLEAQIADLQTQVADLEEKQASTEDSLGAKDPLIYLALVLGIVGLIIGLLAMFRRRPYQPLPAPEWQQAQQ